MALTILLCAFLLALGLLSHGKAEALKQDTSSDFLDTCNQIAAAISDASQVFSRGSSGYSSDITHAALSATEASACSVEPGSAEDASKILRILGSTRTPFAVKGGGHATNPGFSSTTGVQIAMSRFNEIAVDLVSGTVAVGAGLTWDQVYTALEPTGVNVVGGRIPGVGVAGLTLGGGYSYKSSQYGPTIDNVAGYELVLPNGTVVNVTSGDTDIWFGLRGGLNNFGIVTKFILKSHPQGNIWGGLIIYPESQLDAIKEAFFNFQRKNDTKAAIVLTLGFTSGQLLVGALVFYDAPNAFGIFDDFLRIPATERDVSNRTFSDFFLSVSSRAVTNDLRVFNDDVPVTQYSSTVYDAFVNQTKFWGERLWALDKNVTLTLAFEPFDKCLFCHGRDSAYPPDRSRALFPSSFVVEWTNASLDDTMAFALRSISSTIRDVALADGQNVAHAAKYPNYALFGTPLEDMYGGNVERLRKIRAAIDPEDVMGLSGGWKF